MAKLTGFISHSFSESTYLGGVSAFRKAILDLFEETSRVLSNDSISIDIIPYFEASDYGRPLPAQLRKEIRNCDFMIADISTLDENGKSHVSENVMYELGYAMAHDLQVLLIRKHISTPPPADIKDILAASYNSPDQIPDLLVSNLAQVLAKIMSKDDAKGSSGTARISNTWFDPDTTAINIICAPEPERSRFASQQDPNYLFIDNLEDRDALLEISTFLSRQYPNANLIRHSSSSVPPDALSGNLVILGGPGIDPDEGNAITRKILKALDSEVEYLKDSDGLMFGDQGPFMCEFNSDESVKLDWGSIIVAQNPMHPYSRVVVCHGVYTYGTLAAALALSDNPGSMSNHLLLQEVHETNEVFGGYQFEAVFSVQVIANGKISPPKIDTKYIRKISR